MSDYRWPVLIAPLAEKYGDEIVYRAGLDVLGFPPTWEPSGKQAAALASHLSEGRTNP